MTVQPIIERELRVRSRSRGTYWTRFVVALIGALLCVQQMIVSGPLSTPAAVGRLVFNEMIGCAFVLSCAACLLAAEAIGSERREGTLGLLFLTRVRDLDVIVGKLVSVGTTSLCALTGLLPALMIPVLAGGVTGGEAVRKAAGLLATLLLALGAGLAGAAAQAQRFKAACGGLLVVTVAALVPFLCFALVPGSAGRYAGWPSPLVLMIAAGDGDYQATPALYLGSLGTVVALGGLLLLCAGFLLRRSIGRDGGAEVVKPPPPPAQLEREVGLARWRPDKDQAGPIEWLAFRQQGVNILAWTAAVVALAFSRWVSLATKPIGGAAVPSFWLLVWPLGLAAAVGGGMVVAWIAGRFFAAARRTGELELLLPTPVGAELVVADQWTVLRRIFIWPVLCLQVATLLPVVAMTGPRSAGISAALPLGSALTALLSFANTFLGTSALCRLGLWLGLTARRPITAAFYAVGLVQGVPWLVGLVTLILGAVALNPFAYPLLLPYAAVSWLPEATVLLLNLALIRAATRGISCRLSGAGSSRLRSYPSISSATRHAARALQRARHWTPSAP